MLYEIVEYSPPSFWSQMWEIFPIFIISISISLAIVWGLFALGFLVKYFHKKYNIIVLQEKLLLIEYNEKIKAKTEMGTEGNKDE
jgi:homoserine trans-succinylase